MSFFSTSSLSSTGDVPAAASPAGSSEAVPFKVYIHRYDKDGNESVEIHRGRGMTWTEFSELVNGCMYGGKTPEKDIISDPQRKQQLLIDYVDDEGDMVTMSTEMEWAEAQRTVQTNDNGKVEPLRVHVRKNRKEERVKRTQQQQQQQQQQQHQQDIDSSSVPTTLGVAAEEHLPPLPSAPSQTKNHPDKRKAESQWLCDPHNDSVLRLLSKIFGVDAESLFLNLDCHPSLHSLIQTSAVGVGDLDVAIDTDRLRVETVAVAIRMLDSHENAQALELLQLARDVFPKDSVIAYNAACAAALCGDYEQSLVLLNVAVGNGYTNVRHATRDPDLEGLRRDTKYSQRFWAILERM